jgi:hypothetical protein
VRRYTVPRKKYTFCGLLDGFEQVSEFDSYFRRTGFELIDAPWMV